MISLITQQTLLEFSTKLQDDSVGNAIESFLRHEENPGPVVSILGGTARGKSTLFWSLLSTSCQDATTGESLPWLACGPEWHSVLHKHFPFLYRLAPVEPQQVGNLLLVDAPACDVSSNREIVRQIVAATDLALFAVGVDRAAVQDEVAFAQEYLSERPAVLVITYTDLADDEDFADALQVIREVYGSIPWRAIVVSGLDVASERHGLPALRNWWQSGGLILARVAREHRGAMLWNAWVTSTKKLLEGRQQALGNELEPLARALHTDNEFRQLGQLRDSLRRGWVQLTQRAVARYRSRLPQLRITLQTELDRHLKGSDSPSGPEQIVAHLEQHLKTWDRENRAQINEELESDISALRQQFQRYVEIAVRLLGSDHPGLSTPSDTDDGPTTTVVPIKVPPVEEHWRLHVRPPIVAGTSGLAAGLLIHGLAAPLLGPLALPLAALFALMSGGTAGTMAKESIRQKQLQELRAALNSELLRVELELVEGYQRECESLSTEIQRELAAYEYRLNIHRIAHALEDAQRLGPRYQELVRQRQELLTLQSRLDELARRYRADSST